MKGRKGRPACIDCGRPGSWNCDPCKSERRRLADLHGGPMECTALTPAQRTERAARLRLYEFRAALRLPLFDAAPEVLLVNRVEG